MRRVHQLLQARLFRAPLVLLAAFIAGCGADPQSTTPTTTARPAEIAALTIDNGVYSPASVPAGTSFRMANDDGWAHTVTDAGGSFDVRLEGKATALLTISRPGVYQIYCDLHGGMHGTITVT